jgi:hypothetical protein
LTAEEEHRASARSPNDGGQEVRCIHGTALATAEAPVDIRQARERPRSSLEEGRDSRARQTLSSGKRFACLFTDDANPTSNHIYESIGFRRVCSFNAYTIERAASPRRA